jgi:PTS system nitrogen regulatory IIA component
MRKRRRAPHSKTLARFRGPFEFRQVPECGAPRRFPFDYSSHVSKNPMYLNLVQIAESFGVAEKVVEDWIRTEGLPHIPDRGRLLFDRAQVADWAAARGLAAQAGFLAPATPTFSTGCRLEPLLRAGGIWRDIAPAQLTDVLERVVSALPGATPPVRQLLTQRLRASGGVTIAPVGEGLALPHLSTRIALGRDSGTVAAVFLREALTPRDPAPDGVPITRLLFFIAPSPRTHPRRVSRTHP